MKRFFAVLAALVLFTGTAWGAAGSKNIETFTATTITTDTLNVTTTLGGDALDKTKTYPVPLASLYVDAGGPISTATAPDIPATAVDNVCKVVYASSGETAEIQFKHYPSATFAGLQVEVIASSSANDGTTQAMDWAIFYQADDTAFGTSVAQTGASFTGTTMATINDKITLTLDATGIAAVTAGSGMIDVALFNAGTSDNTLEIVAIKVTEL